MHDSFAHACIVQYTIIILTYSSCNIYSTLMLFQDISLKLHEFTHCKQPNARY